MAAAALTPRVRILAVCDEVAPSETEEFVFTLEGVRQHFFADAFPCYRDLSLFLLLTTPHNGEYEGWVRVIHNQTTKAIRFAIFFAEFQQDIPWLAMFVDIEKCKFPDTGEYSFEVWFMTKDAESAQKGEIPFYVREFEE